MEYCRAFACKCRCLVILHPLRDGVYWFCSNFSYYTPSPQGWSILVLLHLPIIILHPLRDGVYWFCIFYLLLYSIPSGMEYIGFVSFTYYSYSFSSSAGSMGRSFWTNCWTQLHHTLHPWCPIKCACLIQKKSVTLSLTLTQGHQSAYILKNLISFVLCKIFAFRLQILKPGFRAKLFLSRFFFVRAQRPWPILQYVFF